MSPSHNNMKRLPPFLHSVSSRHDSMGMMPAVTACQTAGYTARVWLLCPREGVLRGDLAVPTLICLRRR